MTTLEKIRAEIEDARYGLINDGLDVALKIIDKYAEKEPPLEKIRAEITELFKASNVGNTSLCFAVLQTIDKYASECRVKNESRVKNELNVELNELNLCEDAVHLTKEAYSLLCLEASKWNELKECEDAISRQAVLDIINNPLNIRLDEIIKKLPSVQPKAKTGRWISEHTGYYRDNYVCSQCGVTKMFIYDELYDFCPNCGSAMKGGTE